MRSTPAPAHRGSSARSAFRACVTPRADRSARFAAASGSGISSAATATSRDAPRCSAGRIAPSSSSVPRPSCAAAASPRVWRESSTCSRSGRASDTPAAAVVRALEQVLQRRVGADERRPPRRRRAAWRGKVDQVRERARAAIVRRVSPRDRRCSSAALRAAPRRRARRRLSRASGETPGRSGASTSSERAAFGEIDQADVVAGSARQPHRLRSHSRSVAAPPLVRAAILRPCDATRSIGRASRRCARRTRERRTSSGVSGASSSSGLIGYTTTVGTSSSPLRNASTNAFDDLGVEVACPIP